MNVIRNKMSNLAIILTLAFLGLQASNAIAAVSFDLQTDNYIGTHNFQVVVVGLAGDTNTEIITMSPIESVTKRKNGVLKTSSSPLVVTRVFKGLDSISAWREEVKAGSLTRHDVEITMMDASFTPIRKVVLIDAWPSASSTEGFSSSNTKPLTESFTFKAKLISEVKP